MEPSPVPDGGDAPLLTDEYIRLQQQQYVAGGHTLLGMAYRKTLPADIEIIKAVVQADLEAGEYHTPFESHRFHLRLQCFVDFICTSVDATVVLQTRRDMASYLPVARVLVHDPLAFNTKVRAMLAETAVWHPLAHCEQRKHTKPASTLPDPRATFAFYSFFRKLGMKPRFRGNAYDDPGKHDMLYYKVWVFENDAAYGRKRGRANV